VSLNKPINKEQTGLQTFAHQMSMVILLLGKGSQSMNLTTEM
jgi:hypothetical protein